MNTDALVHTYKSLSKVESAFRSIKTETIQVRPVYHRNQDMVVNDNYSSPSGDNYNSPSWAA